MVASRMDPRKRSSSTIATGPIFGTKTLFVLPPLEPADSVIAMNGHFELSRYWEGFAYTNTPVLAPSAPFSVSFDATQKR